VDAVGAGLGMQRVELVQLRCAGGDDQLAAAAVLDAALGAVAVEQSVAFDAQPRLQRPRGVIEAGVDHFAVAGAGDRAEGVGRFEDHDIAPGQGQRARRGQSDHTGTNHEGVNLVHAQA